MALFGASLAALQAPRASATPQGQRGTEAVEPMRVAEPESVWRFVRTRSSLPGTPSPGMLAAMLISNSFIAFNWLRQRRPFGALQASPFGPPSVPRPVVTACVSLL